MVDLHDAFKAAVRKYYEGFEMAATTKVHSDKPFEYGYKQLDEIHQEMKAKKKPPAEPTERPVDVLTKTAGALDVMASDNPDSEVSK